MVLHKNCTIKIEGALRSLKISFPSEEGHDQMDNSSSLQMELETEQKCVIQRASTPLAFRDRDSRKFDGFGPYEKFQSYYSNHASIDSRDYSLDCGINWSAES